MTWYTVAEIKPLRIIFDGECSKDEAIRKMQKTHETGRSHVVVTRGKTVGKFVAEIGGSTEMKTINGAEIPVAGQRRCPMATRGEPPHHFDDYQERAIQKARAWRVIGMYAH
jgi:hypothetical protein